MPSSLHAQITRSAISPRFAISIFLNMSKSYEPRAMSCEPHRSSSGLEARSSCRQKKARQGAPNSTISVSLLWPDGKQLLAVLNRLAVGRQLLNDLSGNVRFNLIQQLHRLDDAEYLSHFHGVSDLDERRRSRRGCFVERPHNRRLDRV